MENAQPIKPVLQKAPVSEKMSKMRNAADEKLSSLLDCAKDPETRKNLHQWWVANTRALGIQRKLSAIDVQNLLKRMEWAVIEDAEKQLGCQHIAEGIHKQKLFVFEVNGTPVSPNGVEFYTSIMVLK